MNGWPLDIMRTIAGEAGVGIPDLKGRSRSRDIVEVRQAAMLAVYEQCGLSTVEVGRLFERDHTTVMHGIERARARRDAKSQPEGVPEPPERKRCAACRTVKHRDAFYRHNRRTGDGLQGYCKTCSNENKRKTLGAGKRHRKNVTTAQTSMLMDVQVVKALRETAVQRGELQSEIVERAVRRELHRMWTVCLSCERRPRVDGSDRCGQCMAGMSAVAS